MNAHKEMTDAEKSRVAHERRHSVCAENMCTKLYGSDKSQVEYLRKGFKILSDTSDIWIERPTFTPAVAAEMMARIENSTREDQGAVSFIMRHLLSDSQWWTHDEQYDAEVLTRTGCRITPLVWLFRVGMNDLMNKFRSCFEKELGSMIAELWQSHEKKINIQGQEQVLKHFADDLKRWGADMAGESTPATAELPNRSIDVSTSPSSLTHLLIHVSPMTT